MQRLAARIASGHRASLSKAITLVESRLPLHREQARELMSHVLPLLPKTPTIRVGISGAPGAGKSTFIEALGRHILSTPGSTHKVAALVVDPSSSRTGGSILGDKTRMADLSVHSNAYVRPSPSKGVLGGATEHMNEAIVLCELCGYDFVVVETVGVGQSEIAIQELVDMVLLVVPPAAGDELQALKKGIVETADMVVVNKADGELLKQANFARVDYMHALQLLRPKLASWTPEVLMVSSLESSGMDKVWDKIKGYRDAMAGHQWEKRRAAQRQYWLWEEVKNTLMERLNTSEMLKKHVIEMETRLERREIMPRDAATGLVDKFLQGS